MKQENLYVATVDGLNAFIDNNLEEEAEDCVEYFKEYEKDPSRRRRREEAYYGWPLLKKEQVDYVTERLDNVKVVENNGIYLIKMIRDE